LFFWFRLNGLHLYYAQKKADINILDSIAVRNILNTHDRNRNSRCFRILDREKHRWKLCAQTKIVLFKWKCEIKKMLGYLDIFECKYLEDANDKEDDDEEDDDNEGNGKGKDPKIKRPQKPTIITKEVTTPIILIPLPSKKCNEGWGYESKGDNWECECKDGREQSPINLPPKQHAIVSPIKPLFKFQEVQPKIEETTADGQVKSTKQLAIKFKENALRIRHKYFGKTMTLDGGVYAAEEIIFHTPAEHQIDGKIYDMEMQIVHYGQSKGDIAKQVVLIFLFKTKPGVYNKFIDDLDFFNLPNQATKRRGILNPLFIPKIFYKADYEDVPILKPFSFYTYHGSLTSPPCSERSIIYVAANPISLGSTAIQMFKEAVKIPDKITSTGDIIVSHIPAENNRTIQPLNGRVIFYYDAVKFCGANESKTSPLIDRKKKKRIKGHYEKVLKKMTEYFYVNGPKPSGLPGAYVVPRNEAYGQGAEEN